MIILCTILFILLSPGILVTLPPKGSMIWNSGETSTLAILVHGVIFFVLLKMIDNDTFGLSWLKTLENEITSAKGATF